jgi:threonine synthase
MPDSVLVSTISAVEYPFDRLEEFADNGESLEVVVPSVSGARVRSGGRIWERFAEFLPFEEIDPALSLGEGNTPLIEGTAALRDLTGIRRLLLKNETQNPTWSFKDRGSFACVCMARAMGEAVTATISTGNMGHSLAAYAARAGVRSLVFVPGHATAEKVAAMGFHGATVLRVEASEYSLMKRGVLALASELGLRIVSGNGPIRVEGYKLTAFEMYEQMQGAVPDFIAVPTSACGHLRGIFKGYQELRQAGLVRTVPRMIIVQAANNSPIVTAVKQRKSAIVPFTNVHTVAEAITTGDPPGGEELLEKARRFGWPAEEVTEEEILHGQRALAAAGLFVEPSAATTLHAVRKLRAAGRIGSGDTVVLMLTGAGLKDMGVMKHHRVQLVNTTLDRVREEVATILGT